MNRNRQHYEQRIGALADFTRRNRQGTSTLRWYLHSMVARWILHNNSKARPKTLFATHYHELNELATTLPASKTTTLQREK